MRPVVYPSDWLFREPPPPLSDFGRRFLAEGDSWFTIGTLNLFAASNILFKLEFVRSTAIVNCAYPGDTLQHMVDHLNDTYFDRLLRKRNHERFWEAILMSAGGNDLIDALQAGPNGADGQLLPVTQRLLLTPAEADAATPAIAGPERYISEAGWARLRRYLRVNFEELVRRRDQGISTGRPLFVHTYVAPTVRPAGTVGRRNGWLHPAFVAYGIPADSRQAVTDVFFARLRDFLLALDHDAGGAEALPQVHVFDSARLAGLIPADAGSTRESGDWINEIHPSPAGFAKIARPFGAFIDQVLQRYL